MPISRRHWLRSCAALCALGAVPQRLTFAREPAPGRLLDPRRQRPFTEPLPNPLDPDYVFQPTVAGGKHFEVFAAPLRARLGIRGRNGKALETPMWGYGSPSQPPTYPGRSFVVQRGQSITVEWSNRLVAAGVPLPHFLPVDKTLHWADPRKGDGNSLENLDPVPLVVHRHGGDQNEATDGHPDQWATPAQAQRGAGHNAAAYAYDNDQEAALLWYHDHTLGLTRLNVYAGLAGLYVIRDANEAKLLADGALPGAPYEVALVLQDRQFAADGGLHYPDTSERAAFAPSHVAEFFGEFVLVNGRLWPMLEVEPRPYRLRLLNGADSRVFDLSLPAGVPVAQIGTDLGLLDAPVPITQLVLAPGERADLVVDFSRQRGRRLVLRNRARAPYPGGEEPLTSGAAQVMAFHVVKPRTAVAAARLPQNLRPLAGALPVPRPDTAVRTRRLLMVEGHDRFGRLLAMLGIVDPGNPLDGSLAFSDPVTESITTGDTEIWEIYNATADAHPMHLHLVAFRLLDRQRFAATHVPKPMTGGAVGARLENIRMLGAPRPPGANEAGLKDTALMLPGEVTRLIATFHRPGNYVWHCHILSHEDHEMMRPFRVADAAAA